MSCTKWSPTDFLLSVGNRAAIGYASRTYPRFFFTSYLLSPNILFIVLCYKVKIDWYFNKCHGVWTPPYSIAHINDRYSMKALSGNRLKTAHHFRLYANVRGSFVAIQNFLNLLRVWSLKCQLDTLDWRHLTVAQILQKNVLALNCFSHEIF